jgi:hypothetical protein
VRCCLLGGHRLPVLMVPLAQMYNSNPSPYYTVPYHDPFPEEPNRVAINFPDLSRLPTDRRTPPQLDASQTPKHHAHAFNNPSSQPHSPHCAGASSATFCATAEAFATAAEPVNPLTASATASVALAAVCQMVSAAF